jgi:mRNA-degrading endonuclease toxin of MazEF toxin-antitoxin module
MNMIKRFLEWIKLKEKLHINKHKSPHVTEGEIWWASLGENIGREINGKNDLFSRPVLIYKKLSRETFLGLPTTSQDRKGTWYVPITYSDFQVTVILAQARVMDTKRLSSRLGQLDESDFMKVENGFINLYSPINSSAPHKAERPREIPESNNSI